jgi:membrane protein YdbS with pleckstrin-like domain
MRLLWGLFKVALVLAIGIPICLFAISLTLGIVGTVIGLVMMAVRLAVLGLAGYALYRVFRWAFGPRTRPVRPSAPVLPTPDPYYSAAMRELDAELRT